MVKRAFNALNKEIKGLHEAAYILAFFTFGSQLLALVRDRLFAGSFGAGETLDIYYAAFRIPDLLFVILSALVAVSVLVPLFIRFDEQSKEKRELFVNTVFTMLIVTGVFLGLITWFITPTLIELVMPNLAQESGSDLILLTRIILLQAILFSFSSLFASIVQAYRRFLIYALAPVLYNTGIIIGLLAFYPVIGMQGLAWGVVLGALFHVLIQLPTSFVHGAHPRLILKPDMQLVREIFKLSIPRTIAVTSNQIVMFFLIIFASSMVAGSISVFTFAFNLQSVPLAIIGMSYSLAAFPTLSRLFTKGDMDQFIDQMVRAARHIIFWAIPITVGFIVLRAQIVRTILGSGEFDWSDTRLTAAALAIFAVSVVAQSLILLFVRGYYAAGQTRKPVIFSLISAALTLMFTFASLWAFTHHVEFAAFFEALLDVEGLSGTVVLILPFAYSLGMIVNVLLLWSSFDREFKCFSDSMWQTILHSTGASLIMGVVMFGMLNVFDDMFDLDTLAGIFSQGFYAGLIGIVTWIVVLVLLNNREIEVAWKVLHKKVTRKFGRVD